MRREDSSEPPIPRTVKPRTHGYIHRPIIVMDMETRPGADYGTGHAFFERTGEVTDFWPGAIRLLTEPSSIIVSPDAASLTAFLGEMFNAEPRWQYKVTPVKRTIMRPNGKMSRWTVASTCVNFIGFQRTSHHKANLYHYPLDPVMFLRGPVDNLVDLDLENDDRLNNLMTWGRDVREWCKAQDLKVSPTAGGLAAQLLRDPRWFPDARRKVPRDTNKRIRPRLPGNYYRLYADVDTPYQALYLDMSSSHHTIASTLKFPHPDSLTARGFFHVPDAPGVPLPEGKPWLTPRSRAFHRVTTQAHGLVYGKLSVPFLRDEDFAPPYMRNQGSRMVWAYTNELPMIQALGGRWEYLTAGWLSFETDPGLNQYAQYALSELQKATQERRKWLKPALLSAYGILAAKESIAEVGYRQAKSGEPRAYPAGSSMLPAIAMVAKAPTESGVVNVLYRGMIEAEQRTRALDLARHVHGLGHRVLAIYADSIFVEGVAIPLLPEGWKVDGVLDGLMFASATHFTSRQLSKLPGVRKDSSERVQLMAQVHGHDRPRYDPKAVTRVGRRS